MTLPSIRDRLTDTYIRADAHQKPRQRQQRHIHFQTGVL